MKDFLELEELQGIDESEFEDIEVRIGRFPFPVICFSRGQNIYYNYALTKIFHPERIKFKLSTEYLLALPAKKDAPDSFSLWRSAAATKTMVSTYPAALESTRAIKDGFYKCYRYKNGLAIKRYEQLEVGKNG